MTMTREELEAAMSFIAAQAIRAERAGLSAGAMRSKWHELKDLLDATPERPPYEPPTIESSIAAPEDLIATPETETP